MVRIAHMTTMFFSYIKVALLYSIYYNLMHTVSNHYLFLRGSLTLELEHSMLLYKPEISNISLHVDFISSEDNFSHFLKELWPPNSIFGPSWPINGDSGWTKLKLPYSRNVKVTGNLGLEGLLKQTTLFSHYPFQHPPSFFFEWEPDFDFNKCKGPIQV